MIIVTWLVTSSRTAEKFIQIWFRACVWVCVITHCNRHGGKWSGTIYSNSVPSPWKPFSSIHWKQVFLVHLASLVWQPTHEKFNSTLNRLPASLRQIRVSDVPLLLPPQDAEKIEGNTKDQKCGPEPVPTMWKDQCFSIAPRGQIIS